MNRWAVSIRGPSVKMSNPRKVGLWISATKDVVMKKTLTLACLAATLILGIGAGPAAASRVDGGQPSDSCTHWYELCTYL
jgi:hypothetical protein